MADQPRVLVVPGPTLYRTLFTPAADQRLRDIAAVTFHSADSRLSSEELAGHIGGYDIVLTGWGTPPFDDTVLAAAEQLKLIAHTAGSIRLMLPPAVFDQGIQVSHAAPAIAPAVADLTVTLIMLLLRRVNEFDRVLRTQDWAAARELPMGSEISGQRVGVVGAGYTGRCVIDLLKALRCEVWVADPYLTTKDAADLAVNKAELHDLLSHCSIVTLQAPVTPETEGMIGAHELSLLPDDAIFINTARGILVDQDALLAELQSGRIRAALDVFTPEPLPADHPLRQLDNVILTPHIAGASTQARHRQGDYMLADIERFIRGEPLAYPVTAAMLDRMA